MSDTEILDNDSPEHWLDSLKSFAEKYHLDDSVLKEVNTGNN